MDRTITFNQKPDCRLLQLSHNEIALIQKALGIAEKEYNAVATRLNILSEVRGNDMSDDAPRIEVSRMADPFGELNTQIQNGNMDV